MKTRNATEAVPVCDLVGVCVCLLGLLALSAASVALPPAHWKSCAGVAIAAAKAGIIGFFFMKLREPQTLMRVFAAAGLFWILIFATLMGSDYLTR